ncbi:hypothetical protein B0H63DRAFT_437853 [Podospora didyma]|uniref:Uncharacterized protein n=1 Tax=Podospora didyma TaxID=330526 RepID=A0AAE0KF91_9PEZI|nr:hypothetical protein B0H63DRAFT_437853 [Podospora didyma]
MYICRACLRRGLGALQGTTSLRTTRLVGASQASTVCGPSRRAFTTATPNSTTSTTESFTATLEKATPVTEETTPAPTARKSTSVAEADEQSLEKPSTKRLEWVVNKHLQYLKDPFDIAEHVQRTLDKGLFDEALLLTRKASRDTPVEVSWNHLIDYQMKNQRLHAAIKIFNEMKKRAQKPNARTYTIIFRGCAQSMHPKLAISEATRIYNTMVTTGTVKPNTIHMNAVLECCARAGDLDTMFSIAATSDESLRAPNNQTFTIILNALRHKPDLSRRQLIDEEVVEKNIATNIQRARALWEEVESRWRKAKLIIDEELVCAMGRVLTGGNYADHNSILELVSQTMEIPNFDKDPGAPLPKPKPPVEAESDAAKTTLPVKQAFKPKYGLHPEPGRNTLSLILTSLRFTKKASLAPRYWDLITTSYSVIPDKDNYTRYLKVLQRGRGSTKAADIICTMPKEFLTSHIFRTGMSTCIHDNLNQHAFANATRIMDVMSTKVRYPDAMAMRLYLEVARNNTRHIFADKDQAEINKLLGKQLAMATDRLWQPFRILMGSFSYPQKMTKSPEHAWELSEGDMIEAMATARRIIAAMDKVVFQQLVDDDNLIRIIKTRRNILNKLVERYIEKKYEMEDKMGKPGKRDKPGEPARRNNNNNNNNNNNKNDNDNDNDKTERVEVLDPIPGVEW